MNQQTYTAIQNYLARLGQSEYRAGLAAHIRAGRKAKTYRHNPSEYHRDCVALLGQGDERALKELKALAGPHSAIGF